MKTFRTILAAILLAVSLPLTGCQQLKDITGNPQTQAQIEALKKFAFDAALQFVTGYLTRRGKAPGEDATEASIRSTEASAKQKFSGIPDATIKATVEEQYQKALRGL